VFSHFTEKNKTIFGNVYFKQNVHQSSGKENPTETQFEILDIFALPIAFAEAYAIERAGQHLIHTLSNTSA
jgi:hypothetical protein